MTTNTPTAWAHLPNAHHIDRILAHLRQHPDKWEAVWRDSRGPTLDAARGAAWDAASVRGAASVRCAALVRDAALHAAWGAPRGTLDATPPALVAMNAATALIAWDDCAYLLEIPADAVKALTHCGNHAAVLLYPAVLALADKP